MSHNACVQHSGHRTRNIRETLKSSTKNVCIFPTAATRWISACVRYGTAVTAPTNAVPSSSTVSVAIALDRYRTTHIWAGRRVRCWVEIQRIWCIQRLLQHQMYECVSHRYNQLGFHLGMSQCHCNQVYRNMPLLARHSSCHHMVLQIRCAWVGQGQIRVAAKVCSNQMLYRDLKIAVTNHRYNQLPFHPYMSRCHWNQARRCTSHRFCCSCNSCCHMHLLVCIAYVHHRVRQGSRWKNVVHTKHSNATIRILIMKGTFETFKCHNKIVDWNPSP